ncbi:MAG TPA: hypothetical protein VFE47_14415 [Tepidisphaeraceae bacterium]|jgi:hypothetical protein|nr:hypothetical protein [Tepidisphaeraceae bacterium]
MLKSIILAALTFIAIALTGCTNDYRPASSWERSVYQTARKDAFPNQVRDQPGNYSNTLVAWVGLLVSGNIHNEDPDHPYVSLVVEHHYYDWLEDHSTQRQRYFLSPRGEGQFRCIWPLKKEWNLDEMRRLIVPGDMMVVYGTPHDGGVTIDLGEARYVREIPASLVATDILDYGRPGEPSRILRTAITQ